MPVAASTDRLLFQEVDNSPLIAFRILFGFVMLCECVGGVATGWVTTTFVEPPMTMSVIGFDWLRPLPGSGMYGYYLVMGLLGALVMVGVRFRLSLALLTLLWAAAHVMQVSHYNNHHYLMLLCCLLLWFCPAERRCSWDVRRDPGRREWTCPRWCLLAFALQMSIVYVYGGVAKLDADWLAGRPLAIWFAAKTGYPLVGWLYEMGWLPPIVAWGGLVFDLSIVPLLCWRRTRIAAIAASGVFHLFNAITFGVGMFPVLGFGFALFFLAPDQVSRTLFRRSPADPLPRTVRPPRWRPLTAALLGLFFLVQLLLPLRHWLYEGHVSWTEEGHRMAWRMMLRAKDGEARFEVVDPATGEAWSVAPADHLSPVQSRVVGCQPAATWQFVRHLEREYAARGHPDVEVYVHARATLNGRPWRTIIDPTVDLTRAPWPWFGHAPWILLMAH